MIASLTTFACRPQPLGRAALALSALLALTTPASAQNVDDLEKGLRILQQVQDMRSGNDRKKEERDNRDDSRSGRRSEDERDGRRSDQSRAGSSSSNGGAQGLSRRVVGSWEYRSRGGRLVEAREFGQDGRYTFRENGQVVERGRWQSSDGETLILRPEGSRSPARLLISRIDRSSMESLYDVDADNDSQPQRWNRVQSSSSSNSNSPSSTGRPGSSINVDRPAGDSLGSSSELPPTPSDIADGYYRSPEGVTVLVKNGNVRVSDPRGTTGWMSGDDIMARKVGGSRIRFTYEGVDQIAVRSSQR